MVSSAGSACSGAMRFDAEVQSSLSPAWQPYCLDYALLRRALEPSTQEHILGPVQSNGSSSRYASTPQWSNESETAFYELLEAELDKVYDFQRVTSGEILDRIERVERNLEEQQVSTRASFDGTQRDCLEPRVLDIIADVHSLGKFVQLNYTGFQKIIKRHDDSFPHHLLEPLFAARMNAKPFFRTNHQDLIVRLSAAYERVRAKRKVKATAAGSPTNQTEDLFTRQTTKYWVHPDHVTEVKLLILKQLPVLIHNPTKEFDTLDLAVSSVYYDDPSSFAMYEGRLKKLEAAEAIRLRWYGGTGQDKVYVERKTHREDWTGEQSVKARFAIKEKKVNAFLDGQITPEDLVHKARANQDKSEEELRGLDSLSREIQYRILTQKLVPVLRTFYNRTAFQLPGDARVRISLDTELAMIRENRLDPLHDNWRRTDIGIDWPFRQIRSDDIIHFPYAILEIKLQTHAGQEVPFWVQELTTSHLVEAVPKFSKYIHGVASLYLDHIHLLPFWYPQMNVDIRKHAMPRPLAYGCCPRNDLMSFSSNFNDGLGLIGHNHDARPRIHTDNDNGTASHANETIDHRRREARVRLFDSATAEWSWSDSDGAESSEHASQVSLLETVYAGEWRLAMALIKRHGLHELRGCLGHAKRRTDACSVTHDHDHGHGSDDDSRVVQLEAPTGKRIYVPVRVEPKVSLAAERTFLSWVEFEVFLGGIASAFLNFGLRKPGAASPHSLSVGMVQVGSGREHRSLLQSFSAAAFTLLAVSLTMYSLFVYMRRVIQIKDRRAVRYHDGIGPVAVCHLLILLLTGCIVLAYTLR